MSPISSMTGVYMAIAAIVIGIFFLAQKGGFITKDSFQVITVVTTTLTIGTYMLWLCAWMHQLHPLITPIWKGEGGSDSSSMGDDAAAAERFHHNTRTTPWGDIAEND